MQYRQRLDVYVNETRMKPWQKQPLGEVLLSLHIYTDRNVANQMESAESFTFFHTDFG